MNFLGNVIHILQLNNIFAYINTSTPPTPGEILEPITSPQVTDLFAGNASLYIFFVVFVIIIISSNAALFYLIKTLSRSIKITLSFNVNVSELISEIKNYKDHVDVKFDMVDQKLNNIEGNSRDVKNEIREILSDIQNLTNQSVLNITEKINSFDKEITRLKTWCKSVNMIKNLNNTDNGGDKM